MDEKTTDGKTTNKKPITLYDMLNVGPFKFTLREIEEMMDEELNSPIETMDTDFIALCADTINRILESQN